jgi:hypothetical protein
MKENFNVTNVQILKNNESADIGINDMFLLKLKIGNYYIPSADEDFWGQNSSKQDEFKEKVELDNLLKILGLSEIKSVLDLQKYCEENCILVEIV